MSEFADISLDQFSGDNLCSTVFFLSHCHSDHMVGLSDAALREVFDSSPDIKLYCHSVTSGLLLALERYSHLRSSIVSLETDTEYSILIPSRDGQSFLNSISVTLIPAGHCPGSVMFLIECKDSRVLYTGDFRFHVGDVLRVRHIFDDHQNLKFKLDSVYVDTTFCVPQAKYLPSREQCCNVIIDVLVRWFQTSPKEGRVHVAHITARSNYGYEFLMLSLARHFQCKVHVTDLQYSRYRFVSDIRDVLTTDATSTKVHFCQFPFGEYPSYSKSNTNLHLPCISRFSNRPEVMTLIPSVMYFTTGKVTPVQMLKSINERVVRVCYSSHSSYDEIVDFLTHLQPQNIYPNVKPNDSMTLADVKALLSPLEVPILSSHVQKFTSSRTIFKRLRKNFLFDYSTTEGTVRANCGSGSSVSRSCRKDNSRSPPVKDNSSSPPVIPFKCSKQTTIHDDDSMTNGSQLLFEHDEEEDSFMETKKLGGEEAQVADADGDPLLAVGVEQYEPLPIASHFSIGDVPDTLNLLDNLLSEEKLDSHSSIGDVPDARSSMHSAGVEQPDEPLPCTRTITSYYSFDGVPDALRLLDNLL